jgi:hypothetical protein
MSFATRKRHRELGLDQRTSRTARFVQLVDAFAQELGGTSGLNPAELILVKQCAATALACEKLQERLLVEETDDVATNKALVPLSNALVRLQSALSAAKKRRVAEKPWSPDDLPGLIEETDNDETEAQPKAQPNAR